MLDPDCIVSGQVVSTIVDLEPFDDPMPEQTAMPATPELPMVFSLERITRIKVLGIHGMTVDQYAVIDVVIRPAIPSPERGFILDPASDFIPAPGELLRIGLEATFLAALPVPKGEFIPILPLPVPPRLMAKGSGLAVAILP
jgi:hypothetical protein